VLICLNCGCGRESERQREIATLESRVYRLAEILSEQRAATRDNVQRKQARTGGERDEDDDVMAEPASDDSDVDDDNDVPYNPKNLPLGWDGKVSASLPLGPWGRPGSCGKTGGAFTSPVPRVVPPVCT